MKDKKVQELDKIVEGDKEYDFSKGVKGKYSSKKDPIVEDLLLNNTVEKEQPKEDSSIELVDLLNDLQIDRKKSPYNKRPTYKKIPGKGGKYSLSVYVKELEDYCNRLEISLWDIMESKSK